MRNLTEGNPLKNIILLAIPIMLGNLFQQLYSTVDAIIVGRYLGAGSLAAVGSTSTLYYLIIWTATGSANGFAVLTAQYFGANDAINLKKSIATSIKLCFYISIIATIVGVLGIESALYFMNTPGEIIEEAYSYIVVILWGLLATIFYNMFSSILRAIGDSKTPFAFLVLTSVLNVVLDLAFIRDFGMGTKGAALATIISQGVSAILCAVYAFWKYDFIRLNVNDFAYNPKLAIKMLKIGVPVGAMGALTASGVIVLQFAVNSYGAATVAAYTASTKLEQLMNMPLNSLSVAIVNFAGQNVGAKKYDNLFKGINQSMVLSVCVAICAGSILYIFAKDGAGMFLDADKGGEVIDLSVQYLRTISPFLIMYGLMSLARSAMQGMGNAMAPLINAVVETLSRIIWTVYLINNHNYKILCLVNPLTWSAATVVIVFLYYRSKNKSKLEKSM